MKDIHMFQILFPFSFIFARNFCQFFCFATIIIQTNTEKNIYSHSDSLSIKGLHLDRKYKRKRREKIHTSCHNRKKKRVIKKNSNKEELE